MKKLFVVLTTVTIFGFYGMAFAVPIVDQEFDPTNTNSMSFIGGADNAQVFTVGITGQLTGVDLWINKSSRGDQIDLIVDIRTTTRGIPIEDDFNTLAHVEIMYSDIPIPIFNDFYHVDLSDFNIQVLEGESLAIVLRTSQITNQAIYSWEGSYNNLYLGGRLYFRIPSIDTWTSLGADSDAGFRTYVDPDVTPEPDLDNDGILDEDDECEDTPVDEIVNSYGCSIEQLVPCDEEWRNHGKYEVALTKVLKRFVSQGLITKKEIRAFMKEKASFDCGK